jgi:hypothetical protein
LIAVGSLLPLVSAVTAGVLTHAAGQSWLITGLSSAGAFLAAVPITGTLTTLAEAESAGVLESRKRVRDAERDLELVLSEGASQGHEDPDERLREFRRATLTHLWSVNQTKLELYHKIATQQARMSFWSAQLAMFIGFGLLGLFVWAAYNASTTAGAVVAGGLGAVSAALAGFISKTFVRSQETAAGHLKAYFDQPLESSRFLAAERLVADSDMTKEQRAAITAELARAIVARPGATPDAGGNAAKPEGNGAAS